MRNMLAAAAFLGILGSGTGGVALAEDGIRDGATSWHRSGDGWRHDSDAFERLSPGNQMIVRSLFEAQTTEHHHRHVWSLDRIAAAKDRGWGNVFKEMQAKGLIDAKNLGQVVSAYRHRNNPSSLGTQASKGAVGTVITTGSGRSRIYDGGGSGSGKRADRGSDGAHPAGGTDGTKGKNGFDDGNSIGITSGRGSVAGRGGATGISAAGGSGAESIATAGNGNARGQGNGRGRMK